ncbi:MAG: hypothetical protein R3B84_23250 [Zavarzinella sp.]
MKKIFALMVVACALFVNVGCDEEPKSGSGSGTPAGSSAAASPAKS